MTALDDQMYTRRYRIKKRLRRMTAIRRMARQILVVAYLWLGTILLLSLIYRIS